MYIKFFHGYGEDKKDDVGENSSSESELSVELQGKKDSQETGKARPYRLACVILTVICLVLLLVVIVLSVKLQTGSTACPEGEETLALDKQGALTCRLDQCQALFPKLQTKHLGCRQCANGWLAFGGSCFYLSTFRKSWDESLRDCSSRGGSLAVISSPEIQSFLTVKGNMKYWIGLRKTGPTWRWVNNTVLGQSYWADIVSAGDCGALSSESPPEKNWMKAPCEASAYFICQLQTQEH